MCLRAPADCGRLIESNYEFKYQKASKRVAQGLVGSTPVMHIYIFGSQTTSDYHRTPTCGHGCDSMCDTCGTNMIGNVLSMLGVRCVIEKPECNWSHHQRSCYMVYGVDSSRIFGFAISHCTTTMLPHPSPPCKTFPIDNQNHTVDMNTRATNNYVARLERTSRHVKTCSWARLTNYNIQQ